MNVNAAAYALMGLIVHATLMVLILVAVVLLAETRVIASTDATTLIGTLVGAAGTSTGAALAAHQLVREVGSGDSR